MFEQALQEYPFNTQTINSSIYAFQNAIELSEKVDIELVAMSEAKIGDIFFRVRKDNKRAHDYLFRSVTIANSVRSKNFSQLEWYKLASTQLQKIRDIEAKEEAEKLKKENAEDMAKIKVDLDTCESMLQKGKFEFFKHLTETHAKDVGFQVTVENCLDNKIMETIMKFMKVVHPDKHVQKERHIRLLY